MLGRLLTISALAGLAFSAVGDGYHHACKAVEAAISNASEVYYPGKWGNDSCDGDEAGAHG